MKLEQQVASLELSKELKKAGYKQEGLWWWRLYPSKKYDLSSARGDLAWLQSHSKTEDWKDLDYVAPTVAELFEQLPRCHMLWTTPQNGEMKYWCRINEQHKVYHDKEEKITAGEKGSDALAKMWLYLNTNQPK